MTRAKMYTNTRAFEDKREMTRHKVNAGDNIYRILPPFGEEADGYPYKRWTLAWLVDPQTGNRRPFASPWSFGHEDCPVGEYVRQLQDKKESIEQKLAATMEKSEIKEYLKPITETLYAVKAKSTFFYNAANKSGQVGVLELKKSAHDALKKVCSQYISDYGCDPTSLNSEQDDSGVWIKISRTGTGMDTEYAVDKNQTKNKNKDTGKVSFEDDQSELPAGVVDNYDSMATDLFKLYREVSYDDLKEVLLFNLAQLYSSFVKDLGEKAANLIIVPGFELDDSLAAAPAKSAPQAKSQPAPKAKTMPKFDDEEEDEQPRRPARAPVVEDEDLDLRTKPTAKKAANKSSVFDLAEDILS